MFTGIIESIGTLENLGVNGTNHVFWVRSQLAPELRVDQSVAHDGVCLTVEEVRSDSYRVTAIAETLSKTGLGQWKAGTRVNLERCLRADGRVDGHFVQGHVDTTGTVQEIRENQGSLEIWISYPIPFESLIVDRGSIAVNGISLTLARTEPGRFMIAIIPHTITHTNIGDWQPKTLVNLEFDILGKYVAKIAGTRPTS